MAEVQLPGDLLAYVERRPSKSVCAAEGIDRSKMELQIVSVLVRQGLTDDEIVCWVNDKRLPKHQEQKSASESWLHSLIKQARRSSEAYLSSRTDTNTHLRVIEIDHNRPRQYDSPVLPFH